MPEPLLYCHNGIKVVEAVYRESLARRGAQVMLEQVERIGRFEAGTRSGEDIEDLHKMRVATRRLRVAFRTFGKQLEAVAGLELPVHDVQTLARALGAVRDLDVAAERLKASIEHAPPEHAPALQHLREDRLGERVQARRAMLEVLDRGVVHRITDDFGTRLRSYVGADTPSGRKARRATEKAGRRLVSKNLRRLRRAGKRLQAPTSEELHRLRIEAKRFRYVCEFVQPVYGTALDETIAHVTTIQDALGEIHDVDLLVPALLDDAARLSQLRPEHVGAVTWLAKEALDQRDRSLEAFRTAWNALPAPKAIRRAMKEAGGVDHTVTLEGGNHYPL